MGCGGALDGWRCSGRLSPAWCLVLPDEEAPELIELLSFLALGHGLPWGVPAQDRGKRARVEVPPGNYGLSCSISIRNKTAKMGAREGGMETDSDTNPPSGPSLYGAMERANDLIIKLYLDVVPGVD